MAEGETRARYVMRDGVVVSGPSDPNPVPPDSESDRETYRREFLGEWPSPDTE